MCKLSCQQLLVFCGLTLCLANLILAYTATKTCPLVKCSNIEELVWTTDAAGERCYVWRNACLLASANCQRQKNYEKELVQISKEECQKKCLNIACILVYQPVCADYNGVLRTFSNDCEMQGHICRTGETYTVLRQGECETTETTQIAS